MNTNQYISVKQKEGEQKQCTCCSNVLASIYHTLHLMPIGPNIYSEVQPDLFSYVN